MERADHGREAARTPVLAGGLKQPHHDGSDLYVERLGDSAELRVRVPEDAADAVLLRYFRDGEPRTVAASIAIAMSQAGQRVCLVDCYLRRPRIHSIFGVVR